jgi:prepilin-type N-terminal cleavage/methylation domain-containing protein
MKTRKGFTLIELLVVIAIIALLLSIVVPSLRMAKRKASLAACLTAMKHVSMAWYMYQEDQNGELPSSSPADSFGWVRHPMNAAGTTLSATQTSPVTDEDEIRGIKAGVLYRYPKE